MVITKFIENENAIWGRFQNYEKTEPIPNCKIMKGRFKMSKKTVKDIDLKGKKVFVRCDFNVPMDENQNITDNRRIVAALPTIKYLIEQNCKIILASNLSFIL